MNFSFINELFLSVILGITQGLAEFLPISSTAHIRLVSAVLTNNKDIGLVTSNIIQLGTTIALIQVFWKEIKLYFQRILQVIGSYIERKIFFNNLKYWWKYSKEISKTQNKETIESLEINVVSKNKFLVDLDILIIFFGTLPIILIGFYLNSIVEDSSVRNLLSIAGFLFVGSLLMFISEKIYKSTKKIFKPKIWTVGESVLVGFFQSLAIFPGISRSGSTISGALFLGRDRENSVKYSFLLSIPAILLAGFYDLYKLIIEIIRTKNLYLLPEEINWQSENINLSVLSLVLALFFSYLTGFFALKWLLKYLSKNTFNLFIIYRLILIIGILYLVYFVI